MCAETKPEEDGSLPGKPRPTHAFSMRAYTENTGTNSGKGEPYENSCGEKSESADTDLEKAVQAQKK